jgi:undecaprenyl-diphosphatase
MESIVQADQQLFLYLNSFHSTFWDPVMIFVSGKISWLPFYLTLIWFLIKERKRKIWVSLLIIALMVVATDQVSVLVKDTVQRLRPCHDESLKHLLNLVKGCGGKYGFVSSHAANSFGVAMFFTLFFRKHWWAGILLMIWALLVSYSRIYLGVHFPGDILGGAILGVITGLVFYGIDMWLLQTIYHRAP